MVHRTLRGVKNVKLQRRKMASRRYRDDLIFFGPGTAKFDSASSEQRLTG